MVPLGRATTQLVRDTVEAALAPARVPRDKDTLRVFTLAEALAHRPKLSRKVRVNEEDLHEVRVVICLSDY